MSQVTPYRSLVRTVEPAAEPVSLTEAKAHCNIDTDDHDTYVTALIKAAREHIENLLDISMINQTLAARYDGFPSHAIVLPKPPMASGVVTISYLDEAGASQSITSAADFRSDYRMTPGQVYPNWQESWPATQAIENAVTVTWPAGYGADETAVPYSLKQLVLFLVAAWFEARQPVVMGYSQVMPVPMTFHTLLAASGWGDAR